jgi:polyhydroxyalkanoate synthesis regulator phasin
MPFLFPLSRNFSGRDPSQKRREIMFDLLKKTVWLGAGLALMTTEKVEEAVAEIVKKGQLTEKEGRELATELVEKSKKAKKELGEKVEKIINQTLEKLKIPSRKEIEELRARVERLEKEAEKKE